MAFCHTCGQSVLTERPHRHSWATKAEALLRRAEAAEDALATVERSRQMYRWWARFFAVVAPVSYVLGFFLGRAS